MKNPNPLMLVRIAEGDAYGMACEYIDLPLHEAVRDDALAFTRYREHPTFSIPAGHYTDDTQMSVAVAEVLLGQAPFTRERFANAFVQCFKRDPRPGYARGFQAFLEKVRSGAEMLATIKNDSDKNGAAMRAVPLGALPDVEQVKAVARIQAQVTHDTEGGVNAAVAVALMSHYTLWTDEPLSGMRTWLQTRLPSAPISNEPWDGAAVAGPDLGWKTAMAVLALVERQPTLLDIAATALRWGGDTDSVLAIAWGIASTRMHQELPPFFEDGLENGPYGRQFLLELGANLMRAHGSRRDT